MSVRQMVIVEFVIAAKLNAFFQTKEDKRKQGNGGLWKRSNVIKKLGEGKGGMQEEEAEGIERNRKENRTRSKTVENKFKFSGRRNIWRRRKIRKEKL